MKQALLSGGSGFIGRALLPRLREAGWQVTLLQRPQHDLLQPASLRPACQGIHTVFHLAGQAHVNRAEPEQLHAVNVTGTEHLLQAAIAAGVQHFVYISSLLADPAFDKPRTAYGESKWQAEQVLAAAHSAGRIRVTIIRPVNVYGVGMKGNLLTLLKLCGKPWMPPLPRFGGGLALVSVQDLCAAIVRAGARSPSSLHVDDAAGMDMNTHSTSKSAITSSTQHDPFHETPPVYTISDGQRYLIKDLEQAMRQAQGRSPTRYASPRWLFWLAALLLEVAGRVLNLPNSPGLRSYRALARREVVDITASRHALGYNPQLTFYQQLPAIVAASRQPAEPDTGSSA